MLLRLTYASALDRMLDALLDVLLLTLLLSVDSVLLLHGDDTTAPGSVDDATGPRSGTLSDHERPHPSVAWRI